MHVYIFLFAAGALSEACVFRKGEWDRHGSILLKSLIACQLLAATFLLWQGFSLTSAIKETAVLTSTYLIGVYGAMLAYRLWFHPLRSFPGPLAAKMSMLFVFAGNLRLRAYQRLPDLHDRYGDFVRIRPREVSVRHPDAVRDLHGQKTKVTKGEFYEHVWPHQNMQLTRDVEFHREKRKVWDRAFSDKAVRDYESVVVKHYGALEQILDARCDGESRIEDVGRPFMDFGFDVISELVFGRSWNMLPTGKRHPIIKEFIENKMAVGFAVQIMWLLHFLRLIPGVDKMINYLMECYGKDLEKRKEMDLKIPDMYTHLSQSATFPYDGAFDAQLAVIAGADTTTTTLTNIFYYLATKPALQSALHAELLSLTRYPPGPVPAHLLTSLPQLNGIIKETLRLHPPVPSGLQRLTPPSGAVIAGRFIPGNMNVSVSAYALHRDPHAFVDPNNFIPDRWSMRPELVLRKDAFIPFSYGPYGCVGKGFAIMVLRAVVCGLVRRFEITVPEGKERLCEKFAEEQADCFVLELEELPLTFRRRNR